MSKSEKAEVAFWVGSWVEAQIDEGKSVQSYINEIGKVYRARGPFEGIHYTYSVIRVYGDGLQLKIIQKLVNGVPQ